MPRLIIRTIRSLTSSVMIVLFSVVQWNVCNAQPAVGFGYRPQIYLCQNAGKHTSPVIDGALDDELWARTSWTESFVDIEGALQPKPWANTRCKMAWDDSYFYVACEMQESNIWATYENHDMVIFHENDIELFIDPDRDTHQYFELEINAKATHWDLMLTKPYRDGGRAVDAWDIKGMKKGVRHQGTLNVAGDRDTSWTVELAIPWHVLEEGNTHPGSPHTGEMWKVNFSRVQWDIEERNGIYHKKKDAFSGKTLPEHNWVWSAQGRIDMHQPETWGMVIFIDGSDLTFLDDRKAEDGIRWQLRQVYYDQKRYFQRHQTFSSDFSAFEKEGIRGTALGSEVWLAQKCIGGRCYFINQEGRVWHRPEK